MLLYRGIAEQVEQAAASSAPVLLLGESGTGKEVVAQAIHRAGPFITIDCGAITGTLLESEIFGHVRGAFTGADRDKLGLIAQADKGTAFFDEIGDLPLELQVKLLRVIQEKQYRPVGATAWKRINFRVIAATHRNLSRLVAEEKFRQDLYYRLAVLSIDLPPLRDRPGEIPYLIDHFLSKFAGTEAPMLSTGALKAMFRYHWPGNIRELSNVIERAIAVMTGPIITLGDLPGAVAYSEAWSSAQAFSRWEDDDKPTGTQPVSLEEMEKRHISATVQRVNGDRQRAAEILGISRTTLFRKMRRYGLP